MAENKKTLEDLLKENEKDTDSTGDTDSGTSTSSDTTSTDSTGSTTGDSNEEVVNLSKEDEVKTEEEKEEKKAAEQAAEAADDAGDGPDSKPSGIEPSETNRKFSQMKKEHKPMFRKYMGDKLRY